MTPRTRRPTQPTAASAGDSLAAARLVAIVESSIDAIVSKELDGTIVSWNRAAETVFGYSSSEMIGGSVFKLIPPELHGEEIAILEKISRGESVSHYETTRLTKDGRRITISLTVSPVLDADGSIARARHPSSAISPMPGRRSRPGGRPPRWNRSGGWPEDWLTISTTTFMP